MHANDQKSILFQMFMTDRWAWSSKDGKEHLPKDSFQLPSVEWIWEGDWYIDRGIDGDNDVFFIFYAACTYDVTMTD